MGQTLYERLGGKAAITAVVDDFVARCAADARINGKFARTDIPRLKASLVDQGPRWVEVLVPRHSAEVQAPYLAQLRAAGWSVSAAGARAWSLHRGDGTVRLELRAQGPSTRLHLAY